MLTYTNPLNHKVISTKYQAESKQTDIMKTRSRLWVTSSRSEPRVVFRFGSGDARNPLLTEIILITNGPIASLLEEESLTAAEDAMGKLALSGQVINLYMYNDAHTIMYPEAASVALATAVSELRVAHPTIGLSTSASASSSTPTRPITATGPNVSATLRDYARTLARFVETPSDQLSNPSPTVSIAQKRGSLIANHIKKALTDNAYSKAQIALVLQSLASAAGVFSMRDTGSPAINIVDRLEKFMSADVTKYAGPNAVYNAYFM
jgi:hypothetical protein